jgi:cytochrome b6-f complex iron-sulfur subunit
MTHQPSYGAVHGPPIGEISRRNFMRRMLGWGVGILTLVFSGGSVAFAWPNLRGGLGGDVNLGPAANIVQNFPDWANGWPYIYNPARLFLINVPAAKALVEGRTESVDDPGSNLGPDLPLADRSVIALYRKCPHLGCQVPQLCSGSRWFECLCHGSKYTLLGEKRDGPAPRGMDSFNVRVEEGNYIVDTSAIITGPPPGTVNFDSRSFEESSPHCA